MQRKVSSISPKKRIGSLPSLKVSKDTALNLDNFKQDVSLLKTNANMKITDIASNTEVRGAFERVRELLKTMSGVKSTYSDLRRVIDDQFKDLLYPIPYTIGSHFKGWGISTTMDNTEFEACVAVRLNALQQPGYVNKCKYVSMYADWSNDRFTFTSDAQDPQVETRSIENVVINVPFSDVNSFPGFSKEEREELANNGVKQVCIIGFRPGSNHYEHLTGGNFVALDRIKLRHTTNNVRTAFRSVGIHNGSDLIQNTGNYVKHHKHNNSNMGSYAWIFMIFILLVIIILAFMFWRR